MPRPAQATWNSTSAPQVDSSVPALGLDLTSAGLTADEAAACAAIVDLTRDAEDVPAPVAETSSDEDEPLQDQAGALRVEVTEPRPCRRRGRTLPAPP